MGKLPPLVKVFEDSYGFSSHLGSFPQYSLLISLYRIDWICSTTILDDGGHAMVCLIIPEIQVQQRPHCIFHLGCCRYAGPLTFQSLAIDPGIVITKDVVVLHEYYNSKRVQLLKIRSNKNTPSLKRSNISVPSALFTFFDIYFVLYDQQS